MASGQDIEKEGRPDAAGERWKAASDRMRSAFSTLVFGTLGVIVGITPMLLDEKRRIVEFVPLAIGLTSGISALTGLMYVMIRRLRFHDVATRRVREQLKQAYARALTHSELRTLGRGAPL